MIDFKRKISGLIETFADLKSRLQIFESKKAKILILSFCSLIALLLSIPLTFNNSAIKFKIEQEVSASLRANFSIKDDIEIGFLPSPTLNLSNSILQNFGNDGKVYNIFFQKTKIKLSFFELLRGNFVIKKIIFSNALIERYYSINSPQNPENKLRNKIAKITYEASKLGLKKSEEGLSYKIFGGKEIDAENLKPQNLSQSNITIIVKNSSAILYDKSAREKIIEGINFKTFFNKNSLICHGDFINEEVINEFSLTAYFKSNSKWRKSTFKLNSPFLSLTIKGNFTSENKGILHSDFEGEMLAEISELKPFYKAYVSGNQNIYNKIKSGVNPIKISAEIKSNIGEFLFNNLVITSNLISGSGNFNIDFTEKFTAIDLNLDLDNLDLDKILSSEKIELGNNNLFTNIYSNFDETAETLTTEEVLEKLEKEDEKPQNPTLDVVSPIKDFDVAAEIKIKNTKYLNGEIKNIDLYATVSNSGEILILPITFEIPGEGKLRANGVLYQDNDLPKFIGKFDVVGKKLKDVFQWIGLESQNLKFDRLNDYIVYSDLFLAPHNVLLNNFYLNLNSDESELLGEIKIDTSNKNTYITNKFRISNFNLDDYFLVSGQNVYFSPGSLLKKLLWLNEISIDNNFDLTFDKITYKGELFKNQSVKLIFGQGYFEIKDLHLESAKTDLMANIILDIRNKAPRFDMEIAANSFYYQYLPNTSKQEEIIKNNFTDQFFALPSLEDFSGNISLKFNKLSLDGIEASNAELFGKMTSGNIEISKFNLDIYDGNFAYKGNIGIGNDKVFNGNFNLNNISLEKFLPSVIGVNNISGTANISANILSSANKKSEFINNFVSEAKFSSHASIDGYGLNDLIKKMFYKDYYKEELKDPHSILFNPQSKTFFSDISGKIIANKNNSFKINLKTTAANGIFSGKFDLLQNTIDGQLNLIFLSGNSEKQIPINIATSIKGEFGNILTSSNLDQIKQYLGLIIIPEKKNVMINLSNSDKITQPSNIENNPNNNSPDILSSEFSKITDQKTADEIKSAMTNPDAYFEQKRKEAELNKNNQQ